MKLAIFDLDNTLIAGDSDCLWGEFLIEMGKVDAETYRAGHEKYYQDELHQWREKYIAEKIRPIILEQALTLVEEHRQQQHELLIITATNRFLTEPIANIFGIDNLIACEPEIVNGQFSGHAVGTPSYAEGKVKRFNDWLAEQDADFGESWFYSDSHNDIPLLKQVDHPVAVDPNWKIISLRQ